MPILLTPQGHLRFHAATDDATTTVPLAERAAAGLARAMAGEKASARGLIWLGTAGLGEVLPAPEGFWRELARRYFSRLCLAPDTAGAVAGPTEAEWGETVLGAPPLPGGEYLAAGVLARLWAELDAEVAAEVARTGLPGGAGEWLHAQNPVWNQVGRVTFHLAENKRDAECPFAFMATYTERLSAQAKPQYVPLGRALQAAAGATVTGLVGEAERRAALVRLLEPVQRAAERSAFVRELVQTKRVFQAQRWTAREAYRFLREVAGLEECGVLVRLPDWWRGGQAARPAVAVTVGGNTPVGIGLGAMLDFKVGLVLDGEPISDAEWAALAAQTDGLVMLKGRWVELDREKLAQVLAHWRQLEAARREEGMSFAESMRLLAGARSDAGAPEAGDEATRGWSRVVPGAWMREALSALRTPEAGAEAGQVEGLAATLRPYQAAGAGWLRFTGRLGLGACLADDMGLGKTMQVLAYLLRRRRELPDEAPALLVLPASLLGNWRAEAGRFAPGLRVRVVHPSDAEGWDWAEQAGAGGTGCEAEQGATDLVITTYGLVAKLEWLRARAWGAVILDEAQAIKNPGTRQARAVKALRGAARVALTGTPVENRLGDLWSLFDFLNPGLLGTAAEFTRFAKKLTAGGGADAADTRGATARAANYAPLRQLVAPYILRRLKSDRSIIADLPDKTEVNVLCGLSRRQAVLYQQTVKDLSRKLNDLEPMARRGLVLATLMRLKQLCNHPSQGLGGGADFEVAESGKMRRLEELVEEIAERQEKALVFTQFREMTEPLRAMLAGVFGRDGLVLHGDTPIAERRGLVERFQREEGPPFFVLSLKAGGTGLTLTEAGHVIHFDRWWNPAVENQATDRAYRIGQKKNVLVHKFVCRGTVEERIDRMIAEKRGLADGVLAEGGEVPLTEMDDDALLRFVALDLKAAELED